MRHVLTQIVADNITEGKWLHTLSLLEHIGARKIGKTVAQKHPTLAVLEHHADEARHAFVFKKLSRHVLGEEPQAYFCAEGAVYYFQNLDQKVQEWIKKKFQRDDTYLNYLVVTCLIERRAMKLYPLYRSMTSHAFIAEELQRVILEEASHRETIETQVKEVLRQNDLSLTDIENIEEGLFQDFNKALQLSLRDNSTH